jgi:hypothetical protein
LAVQTRPSSDALTTQSETSSMTGFPASGSTERWPYVANTARKMKNAIRMFTVGPPAMTMTFFHHGIL